MVYLAYTEPEAIKALTILGVAEKDAVRAVRGLKKEISISGKRSTWINDILLVWKGRKGSEFFGRWYIGSV